MRYRAMERAKERALFRWRIAIGLLAAMVPLSYGAGSWVARSFQREAEEAPEAGREEARETEAAAEPAAASPAKAAPVEKAKIQIEEAPGYVAELQGLLELRETEQDPWRVAGPGTGVFPGNWARIESGGSARLRFRGWGDLELSEGALVKLGVGQVELLEGTLRPRMVRSKEVFTVITAAGTVRGPSLNCTVSLLPYEPEVRVSVHSGRVTLRNEAGEVVLEAGVQASARAAQGPAPHGVRPPEALEQVLTGRVLEVQEGQLRLQTEGGAVVTFRVGAEKRDGVWRAARVGRALRSLRVGEPVELHYWTDDRGEWLAKVAPKPRPRPMEAEEPPSPSGEGEVSGEITGAAGQPLPGVEVELWDEGGVLERTTTDARGRFQMASIPAGPYRLLARSRDGRLSASVEVHVVPNRVTPASLHLEGALP
jgi:hypothetical protein